MSFTLSFRIIFSKEEKQFKFFDDMPDMPHVKYNDELYLVDGFKWNNLIADFKFLDYDLKSEIDLNIKESQLGFMTFIVSEFKTTITEEEYFYLKLKHNWIECE